MKTKTLKFQGTSVTFLKNNGIWIIPAKLLGLVLGYASKGQKLADLITTSWKKEWALGLDYEVFTGEALAQLKKGTPEAGVPSETSSVLFLSMSGVLKVLLRSEAKTAKTFRDFLTSKGGELLTGLALPKKSVKTGTKKKAKQLPLPLNGGYAGIEEFRQSIEFARKLGVYSKIELKEFVTSLLQLQMHAFQPAVKTTKQFGQITNRSGDSTELVPVTNLQASSMTPNFATIKGFFLTGHQKHPKLKDWISAEEIGAKVGLTADQVRKYGTEYAANRGIKLANITAMEAVKTAGGYFRGMQHLVDETGLPCHIDYSLGCAGVWYLMEDGKIVWRNYWSPAAVVEIIKAIPEAKKTLQVKVTPTLTAGEEEPNNHIGALDFEQDVKVAEQLNKS